MTGGPGGGQTIIKKKTHARTLAGAHTHTHAHANALTRRKRENSVNNNVASASLLAIAVHDVYRWGQVLS